MSNKVKYKEPLLVVCVNKGSSTKLIKGAAYYATMLNTSTYGNTLSKNLYIKNVGSYSINYFSFPDGSSLDNLPDFSVENKVIDPEAVNYKGQFVRCRYSSCKSLKEGEIYLVEDVIKTTHKNSYNNTNYYSYKLKIRGIRNAIDKYRFEEISIAEQRNIKLKNLRGDKIKTGEQTRKFLLYSENEKNFILIDTLARVINDINKIKDKKEKINIQKMMMLKGRKYDILEEDITPFLKSKIENLIKNLL